MASDKDQLETPIWKDPDNVALFKEPIKHLVIAGVIAFVAFGVIRPLLKQVMPQPEPQEEEAPPRPQPLARKAKRARKVTKKAPVALLPEAAARLAYDESSLHLPWRRKKPADGGQPDQGEMDGKQMSSNDGWLKRAPCSC